MATTSGPRSPLPRAGVIGLGAIGAGIARSLRRAGVPLTVTTRSRPRAEPVLALGAEWASTPAAVGRAVGPGVVFLALPEAKQCERVIFGRAGLGPVADLLVVNLATISPRQSRELSGRAVAQGLRYLEAPVGGSADAAENGRLLLYVGGAAPELDRARPYLEAFSRGILPCGAIGTGAATKLANNLVTLGTVALLGEALALGESLGLDRGRLLDALGEGGARSTMLQNKGAALRARAFTPLFRLQLALKDLRLVEESAADGGLSLPLTRAARRLYQRGVREGRADQDFSAVSELLRPPTGAAHPPGP
jgi:3-hydroxyisobutyrate dehydrogenase-like beta-hydroxyacid dehydrogenase